MYRTRLKRFLDDQCITQYLILHNIINRLEAILNF